MSKLYWRNDIKNPKNQNITQGYFLYAKSFAQKNV